MGGGFWLGSGVAIYGVLKGVGMKVRRDVSKLVFTEDDHEMSVHYSNRGEPFSDGVEFHFCGEGASAWVLLDASEVRGLRDKLTEFLGE